MQFVLFKDSVMDDYNLSGLLQRFEEAWHEDDEQVTRDMLANSDLPVDAIIEMIMIDLEYRWRKSLDTNEQTKSDRPLVLEDYQSICPKVFAGLPPLDLITEEFRVRQRWGDEPTVESFAKRFSQLVGIAEKLNSVLQAVPRGVIEVTTDGASIYRTRFNSQLLLGRQSVDEPPCCCIHNVDGVPKLIFADLSMKHVSRRQLLIDYHGKQDFQFTNLSRDIPIEVRSNRALPYNKKVMLRLPTSLRVGCFVIEVLPLS